MSLVSPICTSTARIPTIAAMVSHGNSHIGTASSCDGVRRRRISWDSAIFARRRDNQARAAYEAAAGHAERILTGPLEVLVCGGDRTAVEQVLEEQRLRHLAALRVEPWLPVPDPRRAVLEQAVLDAGSVAVSVTDLGGARGSD